MGENPVLCALFFKLCCCLKTSVTFVFVFYGPHRPEVERGWHVKRQDPELIEASKQLIDMFGFYCHQVSSTSIHVVIQYCTLVNLQEPAEAEAELSEFNQLGLIDAIVTKDSNAFIFGAECII